MDNLNVLPEIVNSIAKVDSVKVNEENISSSVSDKIAFEQQKIAQVQKVAKEEAVAAVLTQPELEEVVQEINEVMATVQRDINFSVDEKSGRNVISVYEKGSDTLIRQLPSKEALKLLDNLEQLKGLLFKADV